jgi:hypothetical protein
MCIHHGNWARCVAVSILAVQDIRSVIGKYESCRRDQEKCFFLHCVMEIGTLTFSLLLELAFIW